MLRSHIPGLYSGMVYMGLGALSVGAGYIRRAFAIAGRGDPLVMSEMGVVAFHEEKYAILFMFL